ncbi:MAG: hypothetical protein WA943_10975 [Parvibaculum sp.]|uniref:hypothetical protein n=1 Tax=Parvibaculum sp. TaxID=2024848 RepID=UPI003C75C023
MSGRSYPGLKTTPRWLIGLAALSAATLTPAIAFAQAGQNSEAWGFPAMDGMTMAVIQRQAEQSTSATVGGNSGTTLVCGGGSGGSAATSNSTCVILSNSTGQIDVGQASHGDQSASTSTSSQTNNLSDALSSLAN